MVTSGSAAAAGPDWFRPNVQHRRSLRTQPKPAGKFASAGTAVLPPPDARRSIFRPQQQQQQQQHGSAWYSLFDEQIEHDVASQTGPIGNVEVRVVRVVEMIEEKIRRVDPVVLGVLQILNPDLEPVVGVQRAVG
jgi:hypothetical protein